MYNKSAAESGLVRERGLKETVTLPEGHHTVRARKSPWIETLFALFNRLRSASGPVRARGLKLDGHHAAGASFRQGS